MYGSPKNKSFGIDKKMKKVLLISFLLFFFTTSFAGISTEKKDTLKLIGTSYALVSLLGLYRMEKTLAGLEKVGMLVSTEL